jgi:hypothetical protein
MGTGFVPPGRRRRAQELGVAALAVLIAGGTLTVSVAPTFAAPAARDPISSPALTALRPDLRSAVQPFGATSRVTAENDDWLWDRWSSGVGPSPRYEPMLVDDPAEQGVLLFGGSSIVTSAILNDTWLFRAGTWTELCSGTSAPPRCATSPSPRVASEMAYDPARSAVVLFSGAKSFNDPDDTWLFVNGSWENVTTGRAPPPGDSLPAATDANGTVVIVVTTSHGAETWEFGASGWLEVSTNTTPAVGDLQPMWYDANLHADVLWDQASGTWEFSGSRWTPLPESVEPPTSGGLPEGAAFDSSFGYGFVYAPTATARSTWAFANGTWSNVTLNVSAGPPISSPLGLAYDSTDGYTVAVEDTGPTMSNVSTWILHDPFTLRLNDSWPLRDVGQASGFGITVSGGVPPYAVDVERVPPGCGPPSNLTNESSVECVFSQTGSSGLTVFVRDSRFLYLGPTTLSVQVNSTLGASASATPNPSVVGRPVSFATSIAGGAPPYQVAWQVPGQTIRSAPSFALAFATPGVKSVNLTVTDSALAAWTVNFPVTVLPDLGIVADANTTATDVGYPVSFSSTLAGGISPATANWTFGDGSGAAGPNATHAYTTSGNFTAEVTARDALGEFAQVPVGVLVHPTLSVAPALLGTSIAVAGAETNLTAGISGGTPPYTIAWSWNGSVRSTYAAPTPTFPSAGSVQVQVSVTDSVGARASGTFAVLVGPATAPPPTGGPAGTNVAGEAAVVGVAVVGLVVAAVVWVVRRR